MFVRNTTTSKFRKVFVVAIIMFACIYGVNNFDLTRLFSGFQDASVFTRFSAMNLGIHLFTRNPLIGTGLGRYFIRAYSNREIYIDGIQGLIDPHNTYIFLLSEIGIIGFIILSMILIYTLRKFRYISNPVFRKTAYLIIVVYLIGAIGGSQLLNEISFSTILWIYISLCRAISLRDLEIKRRKISMDN